MDDVTFYERFELVNDTVDFADPRWRVFDRDAHGFLPGYWSSQEAAWRGAKVIATEIGNQDLQKSE